MDMATTSVSLLGYPGFTLSGEPVSIGRRRAAALAVYLAAASGPQPRECLMALIWPECPATAAKAELRRAISQLRSCMGHAFIESSGASLSIGRGTAVDSVEFERLAREGLRLAGQGEEPARARVLLTRAVGLYKGDFLSGFALPDSPAFDEWMLFEEERLRSLLASSLDLLSIPFGPTCAATALEALPYAQHRLQLDELDEPAQRRLMILYALSGQRAAAVRQFEVSERLLHDELGVTPSRDTRALAGRIGRNLATAEELEALCALPREERRPRADGPAAVVVTGKASAASIAGDAGRFEATDRTDGTGKPPPVAAGETRPPRRRRIRPLRIAIGATGLAALIAAVAVAFFLRSPATPGPKDAGITIAVLPLVTDSVEKGQEWFSDGMTDAIITDLAKLDGLRVISHTSVNRYLGAKLPVSAIRKELGTDYLVEGSVLRAGQQLRVTTQLIDAKADRHLWAETYTGNFGDILGLQARISADIAAHVALRLEQSPRARAPGKVDPAAYDAYLLGVYELAHNDFGGETFMKGVADLERAARLDPDFAPPHTALATYYWGAAQFGLFTNERGLTLAKEEAERAVALDPSLSEAHTVLGFVHFLYDYDWSASEREFRLAIAEKPSSAEAHCWYGSILCSEGRFDEAIAEVRLAKELDPFSNINILNVAMRYYYARAYADAIREASIVRDGEPGFFMSYLVIGYAQTALGRYAEAAATLEKSAELAGLGAMEPLAVLAYSYARAGKLEESRNAEARLRKMVDGGQVVSPLLRAYVPLGRGDLDAAMDLIEEAYAEHDLNLAWNFQDPFFDPLRGTPRFVALRKKLGL